MAGADAHHAVADVDQTTDLEASLQQAFPTTVDHDPATTPGWDKAVAFEHRAAALVHTVRAAAAPQLAEFARPAAGRARIEVEAHSAETTVMSHDQSDAFLRPTRRPGEQGRTRRQVRQDVES
ncbi:hypothetical protein KOI35_18390 [Actinoplanes bogorensis]|uniref:Uncharacterized protein n=1 Tax=Paractinoplanes bogorensis TaxID=1610840 RepID=A0ABS5YPX4_9ACTN|nr:hypothetical protein [Actinoplanes bogorensis]MBU2665480.1 hypothetical protein [Actinoplanes bogorensis]